MHKSFVVWFTGLSGAGKTTLAVELEKKLRELGYENVQRLDGDIVRQDLTRDLGFTREDRNENIRRVGFVTELLSKNGVITICSFISPYRDARKKVRERVTKHGIPFIEVYVKCPLEVLIERDPKGLYAKALRGEIKNFTGIDDPYEEPENPEVIVETDKETVEESLEKILNYLKNENLILGGRPK